MNPTKPILISAAILIAVYCLLLWSTDYSGLGIPEYIGNTKYQTYTVAMFIAIAMVLLVFQKFLARKHPSAKTGKLILWSVLICLLSQAIYQAFRQAWILRYDNNDKAGDYLVSVGSSVILSLFIAASIAFELKKTNAILKTAAPLAVLALLFLFREYFPMMTW
jgi:hypothetical protein